MPTSFPTTSTAGLDPLAQQRLDDLGLTFATDAELAAAQAALAAVDALKQDAATAATDAEVAAARAAVEAAMATDAELEAHRIDTTDVHGIADTALLLTTADDLPVVSGRYARMEGSQSTQALADDSIRVSPVRLPAPVDLIGITTSSGGDATSKIRVVVYAWVNGYPGALLLQSGDMNGNGGSGVFRGLDLTAAPLAAGRYFIGAHVFGTLTTAPTFRTLSSHPAGWLEDTDTLLGGPRASFVVTGLADGVTPDPFPAGGVANTQTPVIGWRYA